MPQSNGAPHSYDNSDRGTFEDRDFVTIAECDGVYHVQETARSRVDGFTSQRDAEEWAWDHSYRWVETREEMEGWE
jgi:hypothetical protein